MPDLNPVVFDINPPGPKFKLPHFSGTSNPRTTKIITAIIAIVTTLCIIAFVVLSVLSNNEQFRSKHGITNPAIPSQTTKTTLSDAALPGGGIAVGRGGTTGTNSPVVTFTAEPASVVQDGKAKLKWSTTNNPTECKASDDWSGTKASSGDEDSPALTKLQSYIFTITCKNATGTGFNQVTVGVTTQITNTVAGAPVVTLAANPSSVYTGESTTIIWESTNNPTSCTASGNWSGAKASAGSEATQVLNTAGNYTYTIICSNSSGKSSPRTATLKVIDPPPNLPVVLLSSNPIGPITPGTSVTLAWTITGGTASSCTASGDWSGGKQASGGSQNTGALSSIKTYKFDITCGNSTGTTFDTASVQVLPNKPSVSLTVTPSSILVGNNATIDWSSSDYITSCTASGDWSGAKVSSGSQSTGTLNTAKTYLYNLSCTNAKGTTTVSNVPLTVSLPPAPVVTISASPSIITSGGSSTLNWSVTNNPTSCTASGDWSGAKASSGPYNTNTLSTVKTYNYTLVCSNAGGSDTKSTSVTVNSGTPPVSPPVVTISLNPTSIGTGSSSTLSWSATNSPTSCTASGSWSGSKGSSGSTNTVTINSGGSYSYTLACSNSAGSDTKTATLTVIATPVVTISVSPTSITTGSASTVTWSVTNSPSSCTAGGSWSGSKAASGSQSTNTMSTAGSFIFSLSCSNAGGPGSNQTTLTVNNPAPVYCGGLATCYGVSDLAGHASAGDCWGWNTGSGSAYPWVINITQFRPNHPGGGTAGSLESAVSSCNHDIHNILAGAASISGYKDKNGSSTFNHSSSTKNNSSGSGVTSYRVGYYDATKP